MTSERPWAVGVAQRRLRRTFPHRRVVRDVQGIRLVLPWENKLPDYAEKFPLYGQNLVELARRLGSGADPIGVVDIGANVGDSALQILAVTDARILCVEADDYWLKYLHHNVDHEPRIVIAPVLISIEDVSVTHTPVRLGGTTRFETSAAGNSTGPRVLSPQDRKSVV